MWSEPLVLGKEQKNNNNKRARKQQQQAFERAKKHAGKHANERTCKEAKKQTCKQASEEAMESRCLFCGILAEFWQFGDMCQVSHGTILFCPIVFDRCVWCPWGTQTEGVVFCLCGSAMFGT